MISVVDCLFQRMTGTGLRASFLFALLALALLSGCERGPQLVSFNGTTMASPYLVKMVVDDADAVPADMGDGIFAVLDAVDKGMTTYSDSSELNQLNATAVGTPFPVSEQLFEVLAVAGIVYRDTDGAFDPTVGPLVDLWGFGPTYTADRIPSAEDISRLRATLGFNAIALDNKARTATRTRDVRLDLSAIAQGFAAGKVADYLRSRGFENFMVDVSGEMVLAGHNQQGKPWQVAIERPSAEGHEIQRIIGISGLSLATSGNYRNYFEKDGVRYSHTIDPRTGSPITHTLASVTVIMPDVASADALATAMMVMGDKLALTFAEQRNIPLFMLVKEGDGFVEHYSTAFAPYYAEVQK